MSFKFVKEPDPKNKFDLSRVEVEMPSEISAYDLLDELKGFLMACGYSAKLIERLQFTDMQEDE